MPSGRAAPPAHRRRLGGGSVAHHAVTVYERFRADAQWSSFFAEMEAMRDARQRASGLDFEVLVADYPFLRLGDLISLAFCTGATEAQRFGAWTIQPAGSRVAVTPDLFGGTTIPVAIAAREMPNRRFQSDLDLGNALSRAMAMEASRRSRARRHARHAPVTSVR